MKHLVWLSVLLCIFVFHLNGKFLFFKSVQHIKLFSTYRVDPAL